LPNPLQDKEFVLSGIQTAYKDVKVMQSSAKAIEFLQRIVQVRTRCA
jgi:hypothetical protein